MNRWNLSALALLASIAVTDAQPDTGRVYQSRSANNSAVDAAVRRPIAGCFDESGQRLLVANQQAGTVSLVDTSNNALLGEWPVGGELSDLVFWRDAQFLASDAEHGELICLRLVDGTNLSVEWRAAAPASVTVLALSPDRTLCFAGSRWSRQLAAIRLPTSSSPAHDKAETVAVADLGFAAGTLVWLDRKDGLPALLVLDAFADRWSTHNVQSLDRIANGRNAARRAGGAAIDPETGKVCIAEQSINRLAHSIRNDVHWGIMVANSVRIHDSEVFFDSEGPAAARLPGLAIPLGGAGEGKADPESIEFAGDGTAVITAGGVNQVAIGRPDDRSLVWLETGRRPVNAVFSPDGKSIAVCNWLDDSVTLIDVGAREVRGTVSLGDQPAPDALQRGEQLFFDASLSHDGWMSCHSCHVNGHTSGFRNDNLGDQSFGAPKRIPSLLGRAGTEPFGWNGSFATLDEQIRSSIETTMQSDSEAAPEVVQALAEYVNSLSAPPSSAHEVADGKELFFTLGCAECHAPPAWTSRGTFDVATSDENGETRFNPPSLAGTAHSPAWFHDARFEELADVLIEGQHQLDQPLSDDELQALIAFLNSL